MNKYDIVIVGASIAGLTAALALAEDGFSVALIDKSENSGLVACGEGLSLPGAIMLERFLGKNWYKNIPCNEITDIHITSGNKDLVIGNGDSVRVVGIQRGHIIDYLKKSASKYDNLFFITGTLVGIEQDSREVKCILKGNRLIFSERVFLALGKQFGLLKKLGFKYKDNGLERYGITQAFVCDFHSNLKTVYVRKLQEYNCEVYCTPTGIQKNNTQTLNVNILAPTRNINKLVKEKKLDRVFNEFLTFLNVEAYPIGERKGAGPFNKIVECSKNKKITVIGDSARSLDPVGGMGMTHAIATALLESERNNKNLRYHKSISSNLKKLKIHAVMTSFFADKVIRQLLESWLFILLNNRIAILNSIEQKSFAASIKKARLYVSEKI